MSIGISQSGNEFQFDVLIIGSGIAGLCYALEVLELQPKLRIALISKTDLVEGNSRYAQGGIAAAINSSDSVESHIEDTLKAGDGLCYQPAVECIIRQAPEAIALLRDRYHVPFSCEDNLSDLALHHEGGHRFRRIVHAGDTTGNSVMQTLLQTISEHPNIHCFTQHIAVNLITQYHPHRTDNQGEVLGAYVLDTNTQQIHTFLSQAVILATGGAGKTYRYTTNPMVATGDGVAMAYRAGARVGNMEFYQFHPTLLYHPQLHNFLISEVVRGEGGILRNPSTMEPFMQKYAPEQKELATRDIVARAIFCEIEQNEAPYVYLDIRHQSRAFLKKRFPSIYETLLSIGLDMSQEPIPVVPAAHYQCGGILSDVDGRTDLSRLFAIGEVAFTGLHGANRLASNSLLEAVVMGSNAARATLKDISTPYRLKDPVPTWSSSTNINSRRASQINAHWRGLRSEMTSYAGIIRTEAGLRDVLHLILRRKKIIEEYYWQHAITRDFIELRNILLNAELIVRAAITRRESRGGHYREDFPGKSAKPNESIARMLLAE
ncbi:MAG: L-aspartate oxidase [Legionellaceae bacterium]|nr:L-aspartate oxidase [Legionellaceae bacterium]